jgi:hypothetical protein
VNEGERSEPEAMESHLKWAAFLCESSRPLLWGIYVVGFRSSVARSIFGSDPRDDHFDKSPRRVEESRRVCSRIRRFAFLVDEVATFLPATRRARLLAEGTPPSLKARRGVKKKVKQVTNFVE